MGATNCVETPRQKMIGMMYLVLTALLALNVSKDILHAFVVVDEALEKTKQNMTQNTNMLHNEFAAQYNMNKVKVQRSYDKSQVAKKLTNTLVNQIKDIKREVVAATEYGDGSLKTYKIEFEDINGKTVEKEVPIEEISLEYISAKDNYDKPMGILCGYGEDGSTGKGMVLKKNIDDYKNKMLALFNDLPGMEKVSKTMNLGLNTDEAYNTAIRKKMNWAYNSFYHTVLAADVVLFDKLIAEVKNAEAQVLSKLLESIGKVDFKFDQVDAKVIPNSNYVIQGSSYKANVIIAAYNSTENPDAFIRQGSDTLPFSQISSASPIKTVSNGVVSLDIPASGLGDQKFAGVLQIKNPGTGEIKSYHFKSAYTVAKPTAIVAATKMNVFYIGVDNPVEVSVPGIPDTKITASGLGGCTISKAQKGYVVRCQPGTTTTSINVTAEIGGKKTPMGGSPFRVKPVPNPIPTIGGVEGGPIGKAILLASALIPQMKGFDFDLQFVITNFKMGINIGGDYIEKSSSNNQLTPEMKRLIQGANRGQRIFLDEINAIGPDRTTRKLNQVILKLI